MRKSVPNSSVMDGFKSSVGLCFALMEKKPVTDRRSGIDATVPEGAEMTETLITGSRVYLGR
jgi:hypothetical protein